MPNLRLPATALLLLTCAISLPAATLPFDTVFQGRARFDRLLEKARGENWATLPIGRRAMAAGLALVGVPYKSYTLEIDDRIEAPSANFDGLDCWTFFEVSLAFARMLGQPPEQHTPQGLLHFIELDRYRGGKCDGTYLSRLHYLEDWLQDNHKRGLVEDLTPALGGVRVPNHADEMSRRWKYYRYLKANPALLPGLRAMENRVRSAGLTHVPRSKAAAAEPRLLDGDIIGITTYWSGKYGTSHVGMAWRDKDGVLRFVHASSNKDKRKVVIDSRLRDYLHRYSHYSGFLVARPK